ncbi:MAG: hypothetical protein A3G39_09135 [Deltaproteobacteria bacterium RIFCSPLOWO2_12_FULL_43_16]|nr:MAG: hypothetical protein A2Z89_05420 [Deltaproteobacteria bacterium GWA2_43_19]OGQ12566.1 MAG: hypothetical protein A3D30_10560 [Deltaproteobacteria bacterium RIFCSPHIGHO2_02_FULL_43_33]OGQ35705.1 MAG: hypothetical protein A3A85_04830 [Deltaproteobacteria bacterium RIFCSPLOWO2_01_FULL_42_9]OGQ56838.1 MAG: hypothetical protein A3G39_09135 [Deltaproteobacteria bacterium RIFCSPLOWO2_12_FULL_43_16]
MRKNNPTLTLILSLRERKKRGKILSLRDEIFYCFLFQRGNFSVPSPSRGGLGWGWGKEGIFR